MRFGSKVALSIVACGMLCEGTNYTDWNGGNFQNGDNVNITYDFNTQPIILNTNIKLQSGTLTVNINADSARQGTINGGYAGNFTNGTINFGSAGSNIIFNITKTTNVLSGTDAFSFNGNNFTAEANITAKLSGTGAIFGASGGTLSFQGDLILSGGDNVITTTNQAKLDINQKGGKKIDITGNISTTNGITNIKLDSADDKIQGNITASGGNTTLDLSNKGKLQGNLTSDGETILTMTGGSITGTSTISGSKFTANLTNNSTLGDLASTANSNNFTANKSKTNNLSFTGSNNSIYFADTSINGTLSTIENNGKTTINAMYSTINKVNHSGATLQLLLTGATIARGVDVDNNTQTAVVNATGSSHINGNSLFKAKKNQVALLNDSGGEDFTFEGKQLNRVLAQGTNNTLNSITMQSGVGSTNQIASSGKLTINKDINMTGDTNQFGTHNGGELTVRGNVLLTVTGKNSIGLSKGTIQGSLTTSGETTITSGNTGDAHINGGIRHSNGDITVDFGLDSAIDSGIETTGKTGTAKITLTNNSKLNGDSSFDNATNQVALNTSAHITGNTTFLGTINTLTAGDHTDITGKIISGTSSGASQYNFNGNATLTGGIDTQAGAGKTTTTFGGDSKIQTGISTFHSDIDVTFANNSQANGEEFMIEASNTNITFQDQAKMISGGITTNNGTSNILFKNSAQMEKGSINVNGGTSHFTAQDNTILTGTMNQTGGDYKVNFKGSAKFTGKIDQTGGDSVIKFDDTTYMEGNINVTGGTTEITFTGAANGGKSPANIKGNITAGGNKNTVTFTEGTKLDGNLKLDGTGGLNGNSTGTFTKSHVTGNIQGHDNVNLTLSSTKVDGYLHQGGSFNTIGLSATITDSWIKKGYQGKDLSQNTLNVTNSKIEAGVEQISGSLTMTADRSIITGGITGSNASTNKITTTKGSITGDISQNIGTMDFQSQQTNITGNFVGTDSTNTLKMANGNFLNNTGGTTGNITQTRGKLTAEIVSMGGLHDFTGTDSQNKIHLSRTTINNISQSGGSLDFNTNSKVTGNIFGKQNSQNKIGITGANVEGEISQLTGSMTLNLLNSNAKKNIKSNGADFGLYVTNGAIEGNVSLINSASNGISNNLTLKGAFTQNYGTSTMTFTNTKFNKTTTISNAVSASLIFAKSTIKDIEATQGVSAFNLSDSSMTSFIGNMGSHSVTLVNSKSTTFTQNGGGLTLNASSSSEATSVTGSNFSNIAITLDSSNITGDVSNDGETTIGMQDAKIGGNVTQTGSSLSFTASQSELTGQYKQTDGTSMVNFNNSKLLGGIDFLTLGSGTLSFAQGSEIQKGIKSQNSTFTLALLSSSKLSGGIDQDQGNITGTIDDSNIQGDMTLENGNTNFTFYNKSSLDGNISATNHNTSILIDNSTIKGNMTISGGEFNLTAQNKSTVQGGNGNKSQVNITNADFKLIVDTDSSFNGDINQTNNKQTIIVKQDSTLNGNITNTGVTSSIFVSNSKITGDITQNQGSLALDLSNGGKIGGKVELNGDQTTLSGGGQGNEIGGDFTQKNGSLTGSMTGLTLKGRFSQEGGTSSVSFINSAFEQATSIKDATSSSLTFDHSTLKGYSISGGANNTLKLLSGSEMTGDLTLDAQAQATLKMQNSKITGNINASNSSILNFDTLNSEITGKTTINTGGLTGVADSTKFGGDFTLTNTTSNVSFVNGSEIKGDLTATGANSDNTIKFDASSITGSVSQNEGDINLDLSNGSSIGKNLTFTNSDAHFTGVGVGNRIDGKLDSISTNLTGDVSGLTLEGTFTQQNGTSDITFRNNSLFQGEATIKDATSSNIRFENQSGIKANISVQNETDNKLSFNNGSFITGNTTLTTTTATITASDNSTITGNLTSDNSTASMILNGSTFNGNITQTNDSLTLTGTNGSAFVSQDFQIRGNTNPATTNINLNTNSSFSSNITANNADLNFSLNNTSSVGTPSTIELTNSNITINDKNNSIFNANITDTNDTNPQVAKIANITLESGSTFEGSLDLKNIDTTISLNASTLNSQSIKAVNGKFDLSYINSPNGGAIENFDAENVNLSIKADNSTASINQLKIKGDTLNLLAQNHARLSAVIELDNTTKATYKAQSNGNLNVDTHIANQASTLEVTLDGGILQGSITQDANGNNGFITGEVVLQNSGDFGGRWAITGDSQAKKLTLNNTEEALSSSAIFAPTFNSPLNYIDFTLEREDTDTSTRIGKELIAKPNQANNQPIPPAPDGHTHVRQLHVNEIAGNNGLFRVYADLGTKLADNILANKANGDHLIQVQYRAETFREIGGDRIVVAKVTDPTTTVSFKGTQSEIGLTRYDTEIIKENSKDGNGYEWIIGQATPAGMSYSSKIIASILQSQYRAFMIENDSLDRRLGDLEFIKRDKGFWVRSYIGQNTKDVTDYSTSATDDYYSIWGGFDYNSIGLTVHNFVGAFFNYTGINTESKDYSAKSSNISFGFYNTFRANSGFYADILAKYIYTISEFNITNYSLAKNSPKIDNHKLLLNAEIGYSFYYGEKRKSGYIQPQFQVTSGYIHKVDLSVVDVSGETINASVGRNFPVSVRTGAFWGQVFGEKIKSHIKLGTSFVYDVDSGGKLSFHDSSSELHFNQESDFRWVLSARADFTFTEFFKLYADFDTSFFGNYDTTYSANIGIRFIFGRPNNTVANVPMVYNPYEPPVAINDDRRTVPVVKRFTTKDIDQNYVGKPRRVESQIRGNPVPLKPDSAPMYAPSRKSIRDITSEVDF